jgi:hypothetical protein
MLKDYKEFKRYLKNLNESLDRNTRIHEPLNP